MLKRRTTLFVLAGCVLATTATAVAAMLGTKPPAVTGPLAEQTDHSGCGPPSTGGGTGTQCAFDYLLDPATTSDPADAWHAYWGSSETTAAVRRGWCTIDVLDDLSWGTKTAARTYPSLGSRPVRRGAIARLTVDAAGHAKVPGSLAQKTSWPRGIVTATAVPGRLVVTWQGRTTRGVSLTIGAEVLNPGAGAQPSMVGTDPYQIGVPCADLPPPGPGFVARIVPAVIPVGGTGWLQLRIPGTGLREQVEGAVSKLFGIAGTATVTFGAGRPQVFGLTDRSAIKIPNPGPIPHHLVVKVELKGPTGTRNYRLSVLLR